MISVDEVHQAVTVIDTMIDVVVAATVDETTTAEVLLEATMTMTEEATVVVDEKEMKAMEAVGALTDMKAADAVTTTEQAVTEEEAVITENDVMIAREGMGQVLHRAMMFLHESHTAALGESMAVTTDTLDAEPALYPCAVSCRHGR